MKKLLLATALVAASASASAEYYTLSNATIDVPFDPAFLPVQDLQYTNFSSSGFTPTGPTSTFSISFGNETGDANPGDFQYSADWTYYGSTGHVQATNVTCTDNDPSSANSCDTSGVIGALGAENGFSAVTAFFFDGTPVTGPTSDSFYIQYNTTTSNGTYAHKMWFSAAAAPVPVPAAAWLFGSALVGLAGIGRKRKAA